MYNQNDRLLNLAERALFKAKQANEEALPTAFGNHGAGMVNPDPSRAQFSVLSEMRAAANRQNYLDGQISGTNLIPYKGTISERYQTISNAINNVAMAGPAMGKVANHVSESESFMEKMASKVVNIDDQLVPVFENVVPTEPAIYEQMVENALNKTASDVSVLIPTMIANGLVPQELIPYLQ